MVKIGDGLEYPSGFSMDSMKGNRMRRLMVRRGDWEMVDQHKLQSSRYELKHLIGESRAQAIRSYVRMYLSPDQHMKPDQPLGYRVSSLYLDSSKFKLYQQTTAGMRNRFKLRIRFYDDNPESPAFLEIKRRQNTVILKQRAQVTREAVMRVLKGAAPDPDMLFEDRWDAKSLNALHNFCRLRDEIGAIGKTYVAYLREAYVNPESDHVRVTFDRQLQGGSYESETPLKLPPFLTDAGSDLVILELKFTDRFPGWMAELVRSFNLQSISVPKYIDCVDALKELPFLTRDVYSRG